MPNLKNLRRFTLFSQLFSKQIIEPLTEGTMYCQCCSSPRMGDCCWKCYNDTVVPAVGWENPHLPDLTKIMDIGKALGWGIALHGSLERDLDLIAIPWSETAVSTDLFIQQLCAGIDGRVLDSGSKPKGRFAYSIQIDGYYKLIDLSVMEK